MLKKYQLWHFDILTVFAILLKVKFALATGFHKVAISSRFLCGLPRGRESMLGFHDPVSKAKSKSLDLKIFCHFLILLGVTLYLLVNAKTKSKELILIVIPNL